MNNQNETKFFDLHTSGIGYLNRLRTVKPNNGRPYQAVTIAALRGNADNVQYTYFDCIVVEEEAKNVLLNFVDSDDKDAKYLIGFNIGDLYPETFTYSSGSKQGQTGVSLKGRLIKIKWLRKNNELIYEPQTTSAEEPSTQQAQPALDQTQPVTHLKQTGFSEVFLSEEDPAFALKKETLEKQGYRLNSERGSWQLNAAA